MKGGEGRLCLALYSVAVVDIVVMIGTSRMCWALERRGYLVGRAVDIDDVASGYIWIHVMLV